MPSSPGHPQPVVVRHAFGYHVFLWTALPLAGALVGWVLSFVPGWVDSLAWVPFQGPIELLDQATGVVGTLVLVVVGAVVGGVFALSAYDEIITVEVGETVLIKRGDDSTSVSRRDIAAVFVDGKDLVLTDAAGAELAHVTSDHEVKRFRDAFTQMGYPWHDADPFLLDYARWVPGMPGLPEGANAFLQARQTALEKGEKNDLRDLRAELARLGVVVRDENKKQFWRQAAR